MKKSSILLLLALPFLLVGCGKSGKKEKEPKAPFEVPVVDVDKLEIQLPTMPTMDTTSEVKKDGDDHVIDIYEVSDMHAMIDYKLGSDGYWGFSGMANFFKEKRQENPGTIVISSGDMWQGGSESNLTRGRVVAECMRYVGFEAMALGNHEFDWGEEVLQHNSGYFTAEMPLLGGNLVYKDTNERPSYIGASKVIERGGYKIGVIGTTGDGVENSIAKAMFSKFKLNSSAGFASQEAARLKSEENCDIVVWITHEDSFEAEVPTNVDALFGGHTHINKCDEKEGPSVGHKVYAIETQNYGDAIGHVQLKIDSSKHVTSATGEILRAQDHQAYLVDEPNVKNLIDQYKEAIKPVKSYELNKVSGFFKKAEELANLSCKAVFEEFKDEDTFCALQNGIGGVRADIESGLVTYGDIYTSFPFDNEIVYFTVPGNEMRTFFEQSGVRGCNKYTSITKYADFDTSKTYKVLTTDFVCTNKLDMKESEFTRIAGSVIRDSVAKYIYQTNNLKSENFVSSLANYKEPAKY